MAGDERPPSAADPNSRHSGKEDAPTVRRRSVRLGRWRVFLLPDGHEHLCGYSLRQRQSRVSSPLVAFNASAATVWTASGRKYLLIGPASFDDDAMYAFEYFIQINLIERNRIQDVSDLYELAIADARSHEK
ncbi:MAG: hypothetical protein U0904_03990 [Candidatus Nanopelagicales bacterium]|nr:hypothetical protein [Candidatus Nanopelagicales bacterium]